MKFEFTCAVILDAEELWPDGLPQKPTVEDVRKLADEYGYERLLDLRDEDWDIFTAYD